MAGEFLATAAPGSTLYARIRNAASLLWNGTIFITPSGTSFAASVKVAMVDLEGTGDFIGDCPSGALTAGATKYEVSLQAGGSPASTDSVIASGDLFVTLPATPPAGYGSSLTGPSSVTLTFHDGSNNPVPSAQFLIHGVGASQANGSGVAAFGLPNGTYTVSTSPVGLTMFADATVVVSGTTTQTITGSTATIPSPPSANETSAYLYTDSPSVVVEYTMTQVPSGAGLEFDGRLQAAVSDSSGFWSVPMYKGAGYKIQCGDGEPLDIVIPIDAGTTTALENLLRG